MFRFRENSTTEIAAAAQWDTINMATQQQQQKTTTSDEEARNKKHIALTYRYGIDHDCPTCMQDAGCDLPAPVFQSFNRRGTVLAVLQNVDSRRT
jgi:hypothetical protein